MSTAKQKSTHRCWPGYEPVPGKNEHSPGQLPAQIEKPISSVRKAVSQETRSAIAALEKIPSGFTSEVRAALACAADFFSQTAPQSV